MNKAVTDGITFMPTGFAAGLDVWSSGNGTPGSDTYDGDPNAVFVPSDQDFAVCLELYKTNATQKLRYMGETPLLPGAYLRVTARVKAVSGNLPSVRIAGWAGAAGGGHVSDVTETGPATALTTYGEVVEITAIIGTGTRVGVDMAWGTAALYGHFGVDLTGPTGGVVRIDDIVIEDITSAFLRDMLSLVDVRDFGALGDGTTDDTAAFAAANAAAEGRRVLVPAGIYQLDDSVTFDVPVIFEGTVTMPTDKMLLLTRNYDLPSYVDAFGDEELAFKKAFQALLNNSDHAELDLGGRKVNLSGPVDMQAAVPNKDSYATRRLIRNGQFECVAGPAWDTVTVTSQASYSASDPLKLTAVQNAANVPVGSLVTANGVGREVYVKEVNIGAQEITLSKPLYDAEGTQTYTFQRFQYLLDFSGFSKLDKFEMSDIEFQCWGDCSAILLAPSGYVFRLRDCFITRPKDRGVTSHGAGCQGMMIDRCQFLSDESAKLGQDRVSIGFNANANDVKIRDNRAMHLRHFCVIGGANTIFTGNHFFQGDSAENASYVAPWFTFLTVRPHGAGHFINGLSVTGNLFRAVGGNIDRVEQIDTSLAGMDMSRMKNIAFRDNAFNLVNTGTSNPLVLEHNENTPALVWSVDCAPKLPFGGWAQTVESLMPKNAITNGSNVRQFYLPYVTTEQGANKDQIDLRWESEVKGTVVMRVRMDNPL